MPSSSERDDRALLREMRGSLANIRSYLAGMTEAAYHEDGKTQDAVAMRLVVLGEASSQLSKPLKVKHPYVRWRQITSLRHILAHNYAAADQHVLWLLASTQIDELDAQLAAIEDEIA